MLKKFSLPTLFVVIALLASSCNLNANPTLYQALPSATAAPAVTLSVQADTSVPFNAVGQTFQYRYNISNTGGVSLPGLVSITGAIVACPDVKTIGNLDTNLNPGETLVCISTYAITQADLDRGSITTVTGANVNGVLSNQVTTTVATVPGKQLTLTKTANPATYDRADLTITYTYVIKNSGSETLGPAQFTVTDAGILINCGDVNTTLTPNATVTCTGTYITTQADMGLIAIATNATASGGGAGPSLPAGATVAKGAAAPVTPTTPSNLIPGSTVQHKVIAGEWLWQIARCYGVDPRKLILANSQLSNPAQISPGTMITVPNIGSAGTIYGPPCVVTHVVQTGDTWNSIAQKYNADVGLLQKVNPGGLVVGSPIRVPRNSTGALVSVTSVPTTVNATRINFTPDGMSAAQNGVAPAGNLPVHYVFTGTQGQVLNLKLTAAANSASFVVYAPNGSTVKALDLSPAWSGPLSASGEYRVEVFNSLGLGASPVSFTLDINVAGKCVDVIRAVHPAGTTHLNICGQMDASGKLKVISIHITQRPEDVGAGGVIQTLNLPVDTLTPLDDQNGLIVEDMNADGYDDFRIMNSPASGVPTYLYFIFSPTTKQFVYDGTR